MRSGSEVVRGGAKHHRLRRFEQDSDLRYQFVTLSTPGAKKDSRPFSIFSGNPSLVTTFISLYPSEVQVKRCCMHLNFLLKLGPQCREKPTNDERRTTRHARKPLTSANESRKKAGASLLIGPQICKNTGINKSLAHRRANRLSQYQRLESAKSEDPKNVGCARPQEPAQSLGCFKINLSAAAIDLPEKSNRTLQ